MSAATTPSLTELRNENVRTEKKRSKKKGDFSEQQIKEIFTTLDLDGDGFVDLSEIIHAGELHELGLCNSIEEYKKLLEKADTNGDGVISYEEFHDWIRSREKIVSEVYRILDEKHTGHVSEATLSHALTEYFGKTPTDEGVKFILSSMDLDGNGTIEYEELLQQTVYLTAGNADELIKEITYRRGEGFLLWRDDIPAAPAYQTLSAGFFAGCVSRSMTAPLDRVAMILRAGGTVHTVNNNTSILQRIKSILKTGGVRSLWYGNGINCIQVGPESALTFFLYEFIKQKFVQNPSSPSSMEKFLAGGTAGFLAMTAVYPLYVTQTRLSLVEHGTYSSLFDFVKNGEQITVPQSLLFGASASAVSQLLTAPLLTARTRLMAQGASMGRPVLYSGMIDCWKKTIFGDPKLSLKAQGIAGLYSGCGTYVLKMSTATALQFASFEYASSVLKNNCN